MIKFVNAKINLGLNIVRKREDGYHDLETVFYPVGLHNGHPENPTPFCDIIEITFSDGLKDNFIMAGRQIDCPIEKNLAVKALRLYRRRLEDKCGMVLKPVELRLEKHLPDGAGLGGGSADASFVLSMLNELTNSALSKKELLALARELGADCPFFIENSPMFATGIGEIMTPILLPLDGWWALIVKPNVYVSTRDAFSGVVPRQPDFDLRNLDSLPVVKWKNLIVNDFETSVFSLHPELAAIKEALYDGGAIYASMSGSGSSLYGLFNSETAALECRGRFGHLHAYLCKL